MAYTLVYTLVQSAGDLTEEDLKRAGVAARAVLRGFGYEPVYCNWEPDRDTVVDAQQVNFQDLTVQDLYEV